MALTYVTAIDAILSTFRVRWLADTPALNGATAPVIVTEPEETDLKPHPRDSGQPWTRIVIRHADAKKVTLQNADKSARYRRWGLAWVQVFVPVQDGASWTKAQQLAMVALSAFEGRRASGDPLVFTQVVAKERGKDGAWWLWDVKADFYWDEIK